MVLMMLVLPQLLLQLVVLSILERWVRVPMRLLRHQKLLSTLTSHVHR